MTPEERLRHYAELTVRVGANVQPDQDVVITCPAMVIGFAAAGLLIAGAAPAWWITALVAVGMALNVFMSTRLPSSR